MEQEVERARKRFSRRKWVPSSTTQLNSASLHLVQSRRLSEADEVRSSSVILRVNVVLKKFRGRGSLSEFNGANADLMLEEYDSLVSGLYSSGSALELALSGWFPSCLLSKQAREEVLQRNSMATLPEWLKLDRLDKETKVHLLKQVMTYLEREGLVAGRHERLLKAQVPLIRFRERHTEADCALSVACHGSKFKAEVLKLLNDIDPRFAEVCRLVQLWARQHQLNDGRPGMLTSWSLALLVIFHLQTCSPPVLPNYTKP